MNQKTVSRPKKAGKKTTKIHPRPTTKERIDALEADIASEQRVNAALKAELAAAAIKMTAATAALHARAFDKHGNPRTAASLFSEACNRVVGLNEGERRVDVESGRWLRPGEMLSWMLGGGQVMCADSPELVLWRVLRELDALDCGETDDDNGEKRSLAMQRLRCACAIITQALDLLRGVHVGALEVAGVVAAQRYPVSWIDDEKKEEASHAA